jgi:RNA polymerase sigma factor (sigma-70 family)
MEARERTALLRRALAELSEMDREVLLLWNAGFDYAEIADQTGLAHGAIGTTIARAKKKLLHAHEALEGTDAALG